ncbi:MAG: hypothetical protein GX442_15710 [Candidatus Riflebacteria bacterium]|nr:hypothetical protein [Candidatus Riflebacteria bacterium]
MRRLKQVYLGLAVGLLAAQAIMIPGALFSWVLAKASLLSLGISASALLILNSRERDGLRETVRRAIEGDLWVQLSYLPISKRGVEFFAVLYVVLVLMSAYFAETIPVIMRFWRAWFGAEP